VKLKKSLSEQNTMEVAAALETYNNKILAKEIRGSGDVERAMHRLQSEYGLDYWRQWQLKYRKEACAEFIEQIRQAYLSMLERSVRRTVDELKIEQAKECGADAGNTDLIAEAEKLLAKIQAKKVAKAGAA
jgi:uncharacterized protein YnzC (UPF0291/DUF896 family)